jgi:hypothetical protein
VSVAADLEAALARSTAVIRSIARALAARGSLAVVGRRWSVHRSIIAPRRLRLPKIDVDGRCTRRSDPNGR